MGLQHDEVVPKSFGDAFQPNYLGSPEVVGRLVAGFLSACEGSLYGLADGSLDKAKFEAVVDERIRSVAAVFSGAAPGYVAVAGFHGHSLPMRLIAALGPFWSKRRAKWDDDAVAVLFEWLLLQLVGAWKLADGDDLVLQTALQPSTQQVMDLLLGREQRA